MKRKSKHEKKSGLNEDIGLTSELIDEIKEKMLTEHGALGIQFALALEAMKGSTIPLKIEQKRIQEIELNFAVIKAMITLYEITPTQNAAYDVYSFLLLLENQFKNVRISFFLNKEVNTHLSVLINQLKELQLHYKGLAGDFIPPAVPQNLRRYSR